jgi:hypothetical protein
MARGIFLWAWCLLGLFFVIGVRANELAPSAVALVTSVKGLIHIEDGPSSMAAELKPFVKLFIGDHVSLKDGASLQLVYFDGGLQETWFGDGMLEIGSKTSTAQGGNLQSEWKKLPLFLTQQLAKTPSQDSDIKSPTSRLSGTIRFRSMSIGSQVTLESNYAKLRTQADPSDRTPELCLLAGYFNLGRFDKVKAQLDKMSEESPQDQVIQLLRPLYERAMDNARAAVQ